MNPDVEVPLDARAHNFGAPEIAMELVASGSKRFEDAHADLDTALKAAMTACERVRDNVWPQAWHDHAGRVIAPAYRLFRILKAAGPGAARVVADALPERKRKAKLSNPAHLAMMFTLKPKTEAERKTSSDYASVLIVFDQRDVDPAPENVVMAMAETTLEDCLKTVRDARRASRAVRKASCGNVETSRSEAWQDETQASPLCEPDPAIGPATTVDTTETGAIANTIMPDQAGWVVADAALAVEITISGCEGALVVRLPIQQHSLGDWVRLLDRLRGRAQHAALEQLWYALTQPRRESRG